jgi:hypothetical protein
MVNLSNAFAEKRASIQVYGMLNLPTALKRLRNRLIKLIIAVAMVLIMTELCLDLTFLGLEDRPTYTEGAIPVMASPETETEFVDMSISLLHDLGWWKDNPVLISLQRNSECSQEQAPINWRLVFFKTNRTTLLTHYEQRAEIEYSENDKEIQYLLEDFHVREVTMISNRNLTEMELDSRYALVQAELYGGEAFRNLADDKCTINISPSDNISLSDELDWDIFYRMIDSPSPSLSLSVGGITGEVKEVERRGY